MSKSSSLFKTGICLFFFSLFLLPTGWKFFGDYLVGRGDRLLATGPDKAFRSYSGAASFVAQGECRKRLCLAYGIGTERETVTNHCPLHGEDPRECLEAASRYNPFFKSLLIAPLPDEIMLELSRALQGIDDEHSHQLSFRVAKFGDPEAQKKDAEAYAHGKGGWSDYLAGGKKSWYDRTQYQKDVDEAKRLKPHWWGHGRFWHSDELEYAKRAAALKHEMSFPDLYFNRYARKPGFSVPDHSEFTGPHYYFYDAVPDDGTPWTWSVRRRERRRVEELHKQTGRAVKGYLAGVRDDAKRRLRYGAEFSRQVSDMMTRQDAKARYGLYTAGMADFAERRAGLEAVAGELEHRRDAGVPLSAEEHFKLKAARDDLDELGRWAGDFEAAYMSDPEAKAYRDAEVANYVEGVVDDVFSGSGPGTIGPYDVSEEDVRTYRDILQGTGRFPYRTGESAEARRKSLAGHLTKIYLKSHKDVQDLERRYKRREDPYRPASRGPAPGGKPEEDVDYFE